LKASTAKAFRVDRQHFQRAPALGIYANQYRFKRASEIGLTIRIIRKSSSESALSIDRDVGSLAIRRGIFFGE
jgi:hypothetical protein